MINEYTLTKEMENRNAKVCKLGLKANLAAALTRSLRTHATA